MRMTALGTAADRQFRVHCGGGHWWISLAGVNLLRNGPSRGREHYLPPSELPPPSNENGPFSTDNVEHDDDDSPPSSDEDGLHALPSPACAGAAPSFFFVSIPT